MKPTYAVLRTPGSLLGDSLTRRLGQNGAGAALLDLDAPLRGEPVTVSPGSVVWQGVDLSSAAVVLVERPVYPWPQPQRLEVLLREGAPEKERVGAQREARSLIASAIRAAAEWTRVVNPLRAVHLASSPAVALDELEAAGLAVRPWRLGPAPQDIGGRLLLDAAGRDLWHEPGSPAPGDMAIEPDPIRGELLSVLVAGEEPLGGLRYRDASSWAAGRPGAPLAADEIPAVAAASSRAALESLRIDFAAVTLVAEETRPGLVWLDAGPDLAAWDRALNGRVAAGLADYLVSAAAGGKGHPA